MKDMTVTYHLDLVGHIKQYLEEFNASMFHKSDEIQTIIDKHERGEELSVNEIITIVDYRFKMKYKDNVLDEESLILPDDSKDIQEFIENDYNEMGIYLLYESYYVMKFLNEAPKIIRRALKLRNIFISKKPSQRVRDFCKESYLTYINGNFNASVVILRSILETVLKEKLGIHISGLAKLNDEAKEKRLYGYGIWSKVKELNKEARDTVHLTSKEGVSEEINRELIVITQDVIGKLLKKA